jgi:hypothetical protein
MALNILEYIPRLHVTEEYTRDLHRPWHAPATCPYIPRLSPYVPRLTEEYIIFYIIPILASSLDGEPPKQVIR